MSEIGNVYTPYMLANEECIKSGQGMLRTVIDGRDWEQAPFPYHAKCLDQLRAEFYKLSEKNQNKFKKIADKTNLFAIFFTD